MIYRRFTGLLLGLLMLMVFVACSGLPGDAELPEGDARGMAEEPERPDEDPAQGTVNPKEDDGEGQQTPVTAIAPDVAEQQDAILQGYSFARIDMPSQDFALEDLEGNTVRLSDLQGKIVFLNFWATWCPPCRDEMPHMQTFYDQYKEEDVMVLAVNPTQVENRGSKDSKRAEEKVRQFIAQEGFTFPVLLDREDEAWAVYQQMGIPANYVIDKKGVIRYLKPGAFVSVAEMEAFADAIRVLD